MHTERMQDDYIQGFRVLHLRLQKHMQGACSLQKTSHAASFIYSANKLRTL